MKTFFLRCAFASLVLLSACQNNEVPAVFKKPVIETLSAFATDNSTSEINVVLAEVFQPVEEAGIVWSEKPMPSITDNTDRVTDINEDQMLTFEIRGLQGSKKYYARAYYKINGEVTYSNEIGWEQVFTNEWRRLTSPDLNPDEYLYEGDVVTRTDFGNPIMYCKKINQFTNQALNQTYFIDINAWNPTFWGNRDQVPKPFEATFNPINAGFRDVNNAPLTLYGAGYRLAPRNTRIHLRNMFILESNGNWEPYPGADAPTGSFGIGRYAYVLEQLPSGKLWRFDYSVLKWTDVSSFPLNTLARYVSIDVGERAYILVEPTDESTPTKELYEYLPTQNQWIKRADFAGSNRRGGVGFAYNGRLYYGLGQAPAGGTGLRDIWEYNPTTDTWRKTAEYPGGGSVNLMAINTPFGVLMGFGKQTRQSSVGGVSYRNSNDFWRFRPRQ